jgi:hypothetical protein
VRTGVGRALFSDRLASRLISWRGEFARSDHKLSASALSQTFKAADEKKAEQLCCSAVP